ncbi:hypothetical protein BDN67DRAFT_913218, partial [Paxillus ammoniavirescens]
VDPTIFRHFGYPVYAHISKEQCGGKFHFHRWKCIVIGYTYGQQAYKLLDVECWTVISSCHITFNETGIIPACNFAPWNIHTVKGQWEGLILR